MDTIVFDCAKRGVFNSSSLSNIIQNTYGFTYKQHFRPMLTSAVGSCRIEKLECSFDPVKLQKMKSSLGSLTKERNRAAHTFISDVTPTVSAPSVIQAHFQNVYQGLKDVERCVRRLRK